MLTEAFQTTRGADARSSVTPNARMTTLASPILTGVTQHCLWRVEFEAGARGPAHTMDSEQIWYLESGSVHCEVGDVEVVLVAGDSIRLAGGAQRRFHAIEASALVVCGTPGARATTPTSEEAVIPPWIL